MNIFKMFFRDEQVRSVDTLETYEVRWQSRHGEYSNDTKPEIKVFVTEQDAHAFKKALDDAFKLINHTSGTTVTVKKITDTKWLY